MRCQNCGTECEGKFCIKCGTPVGQINPIQPYSTLYNTIPNTVNSIGGMVCKKCGSLNTSVQVVNEVHLKNKHHGCFWWLCIGWWWIPCKWLFLTLPALIFTIFGHKKQKAINKQKTICVCQNCGYKWEK